MLNWPEENIIEKKTSISDINELKNEINCNSDANLYNLD